MARKPDPAAADIAPNTAREDRLKAALKANLAKRKAQRRGRAKDGAAPEGAAPGQGRDKADERPD